jgi:hypothetical protein
MAQIVATYDTVTKTLSVTQDGQEVADVESFRAYCYGGESYGGATSKETEKEYSCEVMTSKTDYINKSRSYTHMVASLTGLEPDNSLSRSIADYLES